MVEPASFTETKSQGSTERAELSDMEWIMETTKRILDKRTPKKFRLLKDLIIDAEIITTIDILQGVTRLIFEKAILEPDFGPMYSQLCLHIIEEIPPLRSEDAEQKLITFKRVLFNYCQVVFECMDSIITEIGKLTHLDQEMDRTCLERNVQTRYVGNICLMGELYQKKILPEGIIYAVVQELLADGNDESFFARTKVEAVCLLFNAIGKQLDGRGHFDSCFDKLKELSLKPHIEPRWKLMICNILDRRDRKLVLGPKEYAQRDMTLNPGNPALVPSRDPNSPPGFPLPAVKTRICNKYSTVEGCRFGDKCRFAHGMKELGNPIPFGHPMPQAAESTNEPYVTAKITVAASVVCIVTGSGGWKAKDISRRTGARLSITDQDSETEVKNIMLEGTFDQVRQASTMVRGLVEKIGDSASLADTISKDGVSNTNEMCHEMGVKMSIHDEHENIELKGSLNQFIRAVAREMALATSKSSSTPVQPDFCSSYLQPGNSTLSAILRCGCCGEEPSWKSNNEGQTCENCAASQDGIKTTSRLPDWV